MWHSHTFHAVTGQPSVSEKANVPIHRSTILCHSHMGNAMNVLQERLTVYAATILLTSALLWPLNVHSIAAFMTEWDWIFGHFWNNFCLPTWVRLESMNLNEYETKNFPWLISFDMGRIEEIRKDLKQCERWSLLIFFSVKEYFVFLPRLDQKINTTCLLNKFQAPAGG